MDRATFKLVMALGVLLNSALYLAGCITAALVLHHGVALRLALAAAGITYLSYTAQFLCSGSLIAVSLVWVSITLGAGAGVAILFMV